jgi:hypothetical protein
MVQATAVTRAAAVEAKLAKLLEHSAEYEGTISDLQVEGDARRAEIVTLKQQLVSVVVWEGGRGGWC